MTKPTFEFSCPEGHREAIAYDRTTLRESLGKPEKHAVWCSKCGREYYPKDWVEWAKREVESEGWS